MTPQIQCRPLDPAQPRRVTLGEPGASTGGVSFGDDVEELAAVSDVNDLGRPATTPEPAQPAEQHFVQPDRHCRSDALPVVDQRLAVGDDGVHDGVPVAVELISDLRDGAPEPANLHRRPSAGPIGDRRSRRCDPWVVSVNVTTEQPAFGQRHRRFDHTSRVRRPKHGRSASSTSSTSWAWTPPRQPDTRGAQPGS